MQTIETFILSKLLHGLQPNFAHQCSRNAKNIQDGRWPPS